LTGRLTPASSAAAEAERRRAGAKVGVVHFGPGAFHRAHQAWYFDRLMERDPRFGIAAVSLKSPSVRDALAPQDGLFTIAQLDREEAFHVVGSILRLLVAPEDPEAVLSLLASSGIAMVTATVTEKGYCLDGEGRLDLTHPDIARDLAGHPTSVIGYVAEGQRRRRDAGLAPFAVVSCDNLADNGALFKAAVVRLAAQTDPHLADWIEAEARFPRTMVDSITPATDDALPARVETAIGAHDAWPVQRERFCQWVIEDVLPKGAPDLASVGVELTSDVAGYEAAKLRLLNGAHSTLAYLGLLKGHETVADAMGDAELSSFVEALMRDDILPSVKAPPGMDAPGYIAAILERFRNPAIRHLLSQIAWDGSKKLPVRLLGTIADGLSAGRSIERLATPVAAWMRFIEGRAQAGIEIIDPLAAELSKATGVDAFLALEAVFPPALAADERFKNAVNSAYASL